MHERFRTKLMIIMILFSVGLSLTISYVDIERVKVKLTEENNKKLSLMERNIEFALQSVDNALFFFEDDVAKKMRENTKKLMERYEENPNFDEWDFYALSDLFDMDVYILDNQNRIIYTNYPEDLTLEFSECCVDFNELLHKRRVTGEFYHDGLDIQQQTGSLKKFSYQGTPDKQYIIELGVDLDENEILNRFNFLEVIQKLEKDYPMVDQISIFNDEGYRLGRTAGEVRISSEDLPLLMEALKQDKKVKTEDTVEGKKIRRLFVPYRAEVSRGSSTDRVIEIEYNMKELSNTIDKMNKVFILQLLVTICLSVLASIGISFVVSKPMYLAFHDALTGIKNRASYEIAIRKALSRKHKVGLLLFDLDNFKRVNDELGHDVGDMLLKYVAKILSKTAPPNATPYRMGGDEFIIIVERLQNEEELAQIASKLIKEIENPTTVNSSKHMKDIIRKMNVSTSIGGAIAPDNGTDLEELYKKADQALYATKAKGKNGYTFFGEIVEG